MRSPVLPRFTYCIALPGSNYQEQRLEDSRRSSPGGSDLKLVHGVDRRNEPGVLRLQEAIRAQVVEEIRELRADEHYGGHPAFDRAHPRSEHLVQRSDVTWKHNDQITPEKLGDAFHRIGRDDHP